MVRSFLIKPSQILSGQILWCSLMTQFVVVITSNYSHLTHKCYLDSV